jgi:hypothetical protein
MTNFTSMLPLRASAELGSDPDLIALVFAVLILIAALQMLRRALAPLREVLRAVASAAFAALLITSALVLVLYAAVSGHG